MGAVISLLALDCIKITAVVIEKDLPVFQELIDKEIEKSTKKNV